MKLKAIEKRAFFVDYNDLEEFIKYHTGRYYEIISGEEANNDSSFEICVSSFVQEQDKNDIEKYKSFKKHGSKNESTYLLRAIMKGLCEERKLEPGTYIVNVCW